MLAKILTSAFCRHCAFLFLAAAVPFLAAAQAPQRPMSLPRGHIYTAKELRPALAHVNRIFATEHQKYPLVSFTVGVVSGPNLVWARSYGLADIKSHAAATPNSTYRIGSITKQFTAVMFLQLVHDGKVHLTDPVKKYLPEIAQVPNPYPWSPPITLLQLATHTSGLAREPGDTAKYTTGEPANWERTLFSALPHLRYIYEPGTHYSYSNIGYAILGAALARAAGEPYMRYVTDHILKPLGMTHTAFVQNPAILSTLAQGYIIRNGSADPSVPSRELQTGRGYKVPNGALFSTVPDLAKFISFEMGYGPGNVLPEPIVIKNYAYAYAAYNYSKGMITALKTGELSSGNGIGFLFSRTGNLLIVGHDGSVAGYTSWAYFDPKSRIGLIVLHNANQRMNPDDFLIPAFEALPH